jgi:hypothetical protein
MVSREGVREVRMKMRKKNFGDHWDFVVYAQSCKHAVTAQIPTSQYEKVMFIDCDAVVLRNIDHLFAGTWDFAVTTEVNTQIRHLPYGGYLTPRERKNLIRPGFNSGTWAVSARRFKKLLRWWREVEMKPMSGRFLREQSAFNRVALDWDGIRHEWPRSEVALPMVAGNLQTYGEFSSAAIVHMASGAPADYKLRFLFGMYAATFLFDPQLALLNILEM